MGLLGQGSFGITYLAHDFNLDQEVAIKEYLPMELAVRTQDSSVQPASDTHGERFKWGLDRFMAEAKTLARFKHPNYAHRHPLSRRQLASSHGSIRRPE